MPSGDNPFAALQVRTMRTKRQPDGFPVRDPGNRSCRPGRGVNQQRAHPENTSAIQQARRCFTRCGIFQDFLVAEQASFVRTGNYPQRPVVLCACVDMQPLRGRTSRRSSRTTAPSRRVQISSSGGGRCPDARESTNSRATTCQRRLPGRELRRYRRRSAQFPACARHTQSAGLTDDATSASLPLCFGLWISRSGQCPGIRTLRRRRGQR